MQKEFLEIPLNLIESGLILTIYPEGNSEIREIDDFEAKEFSESKYQILEGNTYEYYFNKSNYQLSANISGIVIPSKKHVTSGRIVPNIYVGTLSLDIVDTLKNVSISKIDIEVLATKFNQELDKSYRENYRLMLEDITDKCTELLMQINSPVYQTFDINFNSDSSTIYQRFCFIQSVLNNSDFYESVQKIISNPKTSWDEETEVIDIRKVKRFSNASIRQILTGSNRLNLPENHFLRNNNINSVPLKIKGNRKIENIDTPENRFIKHVLERFKQFCEECLLIFDKNKMVKPIQEAEFLIDKLNRELSQPFFQIINEPNFLKLNSPVLQKRSGYREVLNRWLQFELASKLIWKGGEDVYNAGKKDIASLYEYWLFFTLYDLIKEKFNIHSVDFEDKAYKHLIEPTKDGLNVMVKSGKHTALKGIYTKRNRDLNVKFSYNRTFKGGVNYSEKITGSWTAPLRPDYTLSIWPKYLSEKEAESNESIVHIHFDAKYKINNFYQTVNPNIEDLELEETLNREEIEERKGTYKNVDLLKMHAYKDAIRRSGGAYILYPGIKEKPFRGFHEIIPGLGAFSVNPSNNTSEIKELSKFLDLIIDHLLDRTSQREKLSDETYKIFKEPKSDDNVLHEPMPEYYGEEKINPDETKVIVGFYKSNEQLDWILKHNLYNVRTGTGKGSLPLSKDNLNAKYLILHGSDELKTNRVFQLSSIGPKILSQNDLNKKGYPNATGEYYLVYNIEKNVSDDFNNVLIDIRKLSQYQPYRNSSKPFTTSLTEILKAKED
ncbi:hypothetical protein GCM10010992_07880 [Cloacibacterium rupense]|uniref:DUF2357 domain-containing protein n=1 Tax=Cloacibacterium rupense TaxID=517423 RepID=A0ABQ2NHV4_9FLAO|nr:DUF2357 domain-containing protein [Cloacibacterium rupense]GGP02629.1 hypothetical protein GCM10010992_07880 [Cloacibacterium rupense]